jgi:chemotaxis protein CheZ
MQKYVGFNIASTEYMIPILTVREIITMPPITALPQLPGYVNGVTNLRGSVIPILNLKILLNTDADNSTENIDNTVVVISTGKVTFGIIVDGITGVINVDETKIEQPESFFNTDVEKIEGVAKFDDKLVVLLDIRKLLPISDVNLFEDNITDIIEPGNNSHAETVRGTESDLFNELGAMTRNFHDSLEDFKTAVDHNLCKLSKNEEANAVNKLEYVISKTEEAANKTILNAERFFEESNDFDKHIESIKGHDEEVNYLKAFRESLNNDMTEILTAQQFQDITGQTIKKVITLVTGVESELARLISDFGSSLETGPENMKTDTGKPEINKTETSNTEKNKITQSDVGALLEKYGF